MLIEWNKIVDMKWYQLLILIWLIDIEGIINWFDMEYDDCLIWLDLINKLRLGIRFNVKSIKISSWQELILIINLLIWLIDIEGIINCIWQLFDWVWLDLIGN